MRRRKRSRSKTTRCVDGMEGAEIAISQLIYIVQDEFNIITEAPPDAPPPEM